MRLIADITMLAALGGGLLAQAYTDLAQFGAAGIIGAMWFLERRQSAAQHRMVTEAHERILRDGQTLEELIKVVNQNTQAMTRLCDRLAPSPPTPQPKERDE